MHTWFFIPCAFCGRKRIQLGNRKKGERFKYKQMDNLDGVDYKKKRRKKNKESEKQWTEFKWL